MTLEQLTQKIQTLEGRSASCYSKFEIIENVTDELRDIFDDWEGDEEIREPEVGDFAPNQIEDYHFECLAYQEAQERLATYPEKVETLLKKVDF